MPASKCEYTGTQLSVNSGTNGDIIGGRSAARSVGQFM